MTIDDFDEYEIETDETCDCGNYSCQICSRTNRSPLTDLQEEAIRLLENSINLSLEDISYRHEGDFDKYQNLMLISNDTDENQTCLNIREIQYIEGKTLHFKDEDENDYTVIIEDEDE